MNQTVVNGEICGLSAVMDPAALEREDCPECGQPSYAADNRQFGRCLDCVEAILGERPHPLREFFSPMLDAQNRMVYDTIPDPGVSDSGQEAAREGDLADMAGEAHVTIRSCDAITD